MTAGDPRTEQTREQIADTRRELGDTVGALAAKADVKEQVRLRAREAGAALSAQVGRLRARTRAFAADARTAVVNEPKTARRVMAAGGAALASGVLAVTGWRRYRARRAALRNRTLWGKTGDRLRGSARAARKQVRKRSGGRSAPFRRR